MYNKINTGQVYKKEIVSKIKEKTGFWKKDIELMLLALGEVITEAVEELDLSVFNKYLHVDADFQNGNTIEEMLDFSIASDVVA